MVRRQKPRRKTPATDATALKERHRRFVDAYFANGGNGVEAARAAGFSGSPAVLATRASELLRRADVKAAMKERVEADPSIADRDELLRFFTRVARGVDEKGRPLKTGLKDRLEAAKQAGRAIGIFVIRHQVEVTGQVLVCLPDNQRGDGPAPVPPPPPT